MFKMFYNYVRRL